MHVQRVWKKVTPWTSYNRNVKSKRIWLKFCALKSKQIVEKTKFCEKYYFLAELLILLNIDNIYVTNMALHKQTLAFV